MRRHLVSIAVPVVLVVSACGDGAVESTGREAATTAAATPPTAVTAPTTTTTATTTTSSSTTTSSTTSTTTTTTLPPPPIDAWGGEGVSELAVTYPGPDGGLGVSEVVEGALGAMGIDVVAAAAVVLEVDVDLTAYYVDYEEGRCYKGSAVEGSVSLVDTTGANEMLRADIDDEFPPPPFLFGGCSETDPEDAPFGYSFEPGFLEAVVSWWGESSVPYLTELLMADHFLLDVRIAAIQEVRLMDWGSIPGERRFDLLDAALAFCERITHMDEVDEARTYRAAVERLFEETLDWDIEIPVTGNSTADALEIRVLRRALGGRF